MLDAMHAAPLTGSTVLRVRTYLLVNLVAIWVSVVALAALNEWMGPSTSLAVDIAALAAAGTAYGLAYALTTRHRARPAAVLAIAATWLVAFSLAWATPFTTPVSLLVLHVPLLILTDMFRVRTRTVLLGTTVVLTGVLVVVGESRRSVWDADHPDIPALAPLVGVFTVVVAAVLVLGIRDAVLRLARSRRELEASRARLAVANLDARRSIERDLHDGAQQRLTSLAVDIGRLTRALDADLDRARALAAGLQGQLEEAMRELRDLAHGIYPPLLEERGLAGALPAASRRTTLPCVVDVGADFQRYPADVEAAVYFCCLEAMQNADRHSRGSLITVRLTDTGAEGDLRFSVSDDGTGFDVAAHPGAHGLTGMRDRIQSAGGTLTIRSRPAGGTTVEGWFGPGTADPT